MFHQLNLTLFFSW